MNMVDIRIKNIDWELRKSVLTDESLWYASISGVKFLMIYTHFKGKYVIHTTFPSFEYKGKEAFKYGKFDTLEECMSVSEKLIKKEILKFIEK